VEQSYTISERSGSYVSLISQVRERCLAAQICETRQWIDGQILAATNDWHLRMLTTYRDHWWAEIIGDLDGVMATLAPDPTYRAYGGRAFGNLKINTTAEARDLYRSLFDAGYFPAGPLHEARYAMGDWGMMIEGVTTAVLPGTFFALPELNLQPATPYQASWHLMGIHPMDRNTGLMTAEILYVSDPIAIVPAVR
jgi:hypothetical protein